jgi:hypothetical protein
LEKLNREWIASKRPNSGFLLRDETNAKYIFNAAAVVHGSGAVALVVLCVHVVEEVHDPVGVAILVVVPETGVACSNLDARI